MITTINQEAILSGVVSIQESSLSGKVSIPDAIAVPFYEGEYVVTPKVESDSVLSTKGKQMQQDVTVLKIPQFEVSNESGGKTLIIGEEYYNG